MGEPNKCNGVKPGGRQPDAGARGIAEATERKPKIEDGGRHFKASGADNGTKRRVILENAPKYSISAMCKILKIARSTLYYKEKPAKDETTLENAVQTAFEENRGVYGSRKIKRVLSKKGIIISKEKICRIMNRRGLESAYTRKKYKNHSKKCNESAVPNLLDRQFGGQERLAAVVSDLTYVRVGQKWQYACILLDLHNREIIGHSSGAHKDAALVRAAFVRVNVSLSQIQMFHTDRGSEFDNALIDELLDAFNINRSLSLRGNPLDNAVAEATFKLIKVEFIYRRIFDSPEQLALELADYVHWFNNIRLHSSLDYLSPVEFRQHTSYFLSN